jgi:predicted nucleic acid-binding protein
MKVAVDTTILIYMFKDPESAASTPEQAEYQRRGNVLLRDLEEQEAELIVPSIVIGEYLCGINPKLHSRVIAEFNDRFYAIPSFDLAASAKAAELWIAHRKLPKEDQLIRNHLKVDVMIIACAKVARATRYYSHEPKCRTIAKLAGMTPRDLPTHSENLLTNAEIMQDKSI